jgi:hypothetical protein
MVGKSTRGSGATGNSGYAAMPTSTKAAINSDVATGRRMNGVEMLTSSTSPLSCWLPFLTGVQAAA